MHKESRIEKAEDDNNKKDGSHTKAANLIMTSEEILKSYEKNDRVVEINGKWIDVDWPNTEWARWGNHARWGNVL